MAFPNKYNKICELFLHDSARNEWYVSQHERTRITIDKEGIYISLIEPSLSENNEHFLDKIDFTGDDILTGKVFAFTFLRIIINIH